MTPKPPNSGRRARSPKAEAVAQSPSAELREPQQARGYERAASLLDAAAEIIADGGIEKLSMQALADRAGATTGSIYHFFGGKDGVLLALYERYAQEFRRINQHLLSVPLPKWRRMAVDVFVNEFFGPPSMFLRENPAFTSLGRQGAWQHPAVDAQQVRDLAAHFAVILRDRWPLLSREEATTMSMLVFAMGDGVLQEMGRVDAAEGNRLFGDFTLAVAAYLKARQPTARR